MLDHTYYRLTAYDSEGTQTILHYDATDDRRVVGGTFTEEKNLIPSLTFGIYNDNPGYDLLTEFDTRITLEEMYDAYASNYVGDPIVEIDLIDGTEDEYRLRWLDVSNASVELIDDAEDEYRLVLPQYVSLSENKSSSGLIIEDEYILIVANISTETTIPMVKYLFEGRVVANKIVLESSGLVYRDITCEGLLGYLKDSMQPYMEEQLWADDAESSGLYKYMQHLLDVHNSQVEEYKRIYIAVCDTTTNLTNEQVVKGTNWQTTWDVMSDKLLDVFGGELEVARGSDGLLYLYYTDRIADLALSSKPLQPIRLGVNVISGSNEPQTEQVITRLFPLGAKLEDDEGNETDERLTIEKASKSGGLTYIEDTAMKAKYGIVCATQEWDDVTVADNLYTKAVEWLEANNNYPVSVELDAYDLSLLGYDYEHFELYRNVIVDASPLETDQLVDNGTVEIIKRQLSLDSPWKTTFTFGDTTLTGSARYARLKQKSFEDVTARTSQNETDISILQNLLKQVQALMNNVVYWNLLEATSSEWSDWYELKTTDTDNYTVYLYYCYDMSYFTIGTTLSFGFDIEFSGVKAGTAGTFKIYSQDSWYIDGGTTIWNKGPCYGAMTITSAPADGVYHYSNTTTYTTDYSGYDYARLSIRIDYTTAGKFRIRNVMLSPTSTEVSWGPAKADIA